MFQFHYGSIKILHCVVISINNLRFNSTMVRLKFPILKAKYTFLPSFNSTMVRLKSFPDFANLGAESMFQFHYGSIKIIC